MQLPHPVLNDHFDLVTLRVVVAVADAGSISAGSDQVQLALGRRVRVYPHWKRAWAFAFSSGLRAE
ncbi:MAG: hypothetical protein IPJ18_03665 [Betaproteobacteria bacterium]|nr:hypothetical protein [Betaproteobacteria bacterium]